MPEETSKTITITALVEKDFEPDIFRVEIIFEGEQDDKSECVAAYNADRKRVLAALGEAGVASDEVRTGAFRVSAHYEWYYEKATGAPYERYRRTERYVDGCEYSGDCHFERGMDLELLGSVWNALQNTEGDFTFEVTYDLEHPDECERELLRAAVAEARSRAELLADAAGAKLGGIASMKHGFRHAASSYSQPIMLYAAEDCGYDDEGSSAPALNPETILVSCEVSASWFIA